VLEVAYSGGLERPNREKATSWSVPLLGTFLAFDWLGNRLSWAKEIDTMFGSFPDGGFTEIVQKAIILGDAKGESMLFLF